MSDQRKPTSERFVSAVLRAELAYGESSAAMIGNMARKMARELVERGPIGTAGIIVTLATKDLEEELEPFNSPIDPAILEPEQQQPIETGHVTDHQGTPHTYDCGCGWSTENVLELVEHLEKHGVKRVIITPAMGRRR